MCRGLRLLPKPLTVIPIKSLTLVRSHTPFRRRGARWPWCAGAGEAITHGILPAELVRILFLVVALSMALTPFLAEAGQKLGKAFDKGDRKLRLRFVFFFSLPFMQMFPVQLAPTPFPADAGQKLSKAFGKGDIHGGCFGAM